MFALLPVLGGFLLGWLAPRRIAIPVEIALFIVGGIIFVLSAHRHDTTYLHSAVLCLPIAVVSAGTMVLGMWLRRRRSRTVTS